MGFLSGAWAFMKSAPALWSFYKEMKKVIEYTNHKVDSKKRIKQLKDGFEFARRTKNTSELEKVFRNAK